MSIAEGVLVAFIIGTVWLYLAETVYPTTKSRFRLIRERLGWYVRKRRKQKLCSLHVLTHLRKGNLALVDHKRCEACILELRKLM